MNNSGLSPPDLGKTKEAAAAACRRLRNSQNFSGDHIADDFLSTSCSNGGTLFDDEDDTNNSHEGMCANPVKPEESYTTMTINEIINGSVRLFYLPLSLCSLTLTMHLSLLLDLLSWLKMGLGMYPRAGAFTLLHLAGHLSGPHLSHPSVLEYDRYRPTHSLLHPSVLETHFTQGFR